MTLLILLRNTRTTTQDAGHPVVDEHVASPFRRPFVTPRLPQPRTVHVAATTRLGSRRHVTLRTERATAGRASTASRATVCVSRQAPARAATIRRGARHVSVITTRAARVHTIRTYRQQRDDLALLLLMEDR